MVANRNVKVGFALFDLKDYLPSIKPFHDPMEGEVFYLQGEQQVLWFSFDLLTLSVPVSLEIRQNLADNLGVPASNIVLHVTHNHTAPVEGDLLESDNDYKKLVQCLVKGARQAMDNAEPACIAHIRRKVPKGIFVRRRQRFEPYLGDMCVYMGYDKLNNGQPDATKVNLSRIEHWLGNNIKEYIDQIPRSMIYDRPIDENLDLLLFQSINGRPLGSVVRFAAHVIAAGHCPIKQYSAGFPGILRKLIQLHFGGICLSINGPCGDITLFEQIPFQFPQPVKEPQPQGPLCMSHINEKDTWKEVQRIGQSLYNPLAKADNISFEPIREMSFVEKELNIPMRKDLVDLETAENLYREHYTTFLNLVNTKASLRTIKQEADLCRFYAEHKNFYGCWRYLWPDDLERKKVRCFVSSLQINHIVIAGLPGEVFMDTGEAVRQAVEQNGAQCITATECNGDIGYIPTPIDIPGGDYEPNCCVLAPQASKLLIDALIGIS